MHDEMGQKEQLWRLLQNAEIPGWNREALEKLWHYHTLLQDANDDRDLSRLISFHDIVIKHYLDSALVLKYIPQLPSPLVDIGTGAGFPGMVLKILHPDTDVILAEVRKKRVAFLDHVIHQLGLTKIQTFAHRVGPGFALPVQGVITRALESIPETLSRSSFFLPEDGQVLLMKGPRSKQEEEQANEQFHGDYKLHARYEYQLHDSSHHRTLYQYTRQRESIQRRGQLVGQEQAGLDSNRMVKEITSPANPVFKIFRKILDSPGINKENQYLVSGQKIIYEVLAFAEKNRAIRSQCMGIVLAASMERLLSDKVSNEMQIYVLKDSLFAELDLFKTRYPLLLMKKPALEMWKGNIEPGEMALFLPFQDPGNLGTSIRSAAAFGVDRVILLQEAASPWHPKAVRAAGSTLMLVRLEQGPSLAELVRLSVDLPMAFLDSGGQAIERMSDLTEVGIVAGMEGQGFAGNTNIFPEKKYQIAISDQVDSLNGALAVSIAMFAYRQR